MRPLRAGLTSLAAFVLLAGLSLATPSATLASDGFVEKATTTYVVNPDKDRLDVTIDLSFKNTKRSTATTYYFYDSDYLWLERDATSIKATSPGVTIKISRVKRSDHFDQYRFRWSPVLLYGKTRKLHITYQIPTGAPRSDSWFRVSPAYLDFCVIGTGADGGSTSIRVPLTYDMTVGSEQGGRLGQRIEDDTRVYTTGDLDEPYLFWACLTGEQPAAFHAATIQSPSGREITIQSWPNDLDWGTQISGQIDQILARLEDLIGHGLPGDGPIAVREVGAGTLGQYAGFFDPETGIARIGEDLEAKGLLTHELSHAWFNGDLFQSHWLAEGYAEWARTSIDVDTCPDSGRYPGAGAANLEQWQFIGPRATEQELAVVDWEYATACWIVSQVASKIGPDRMRLVLAALLAHDLAYRSGTTVLKGLPVAASWQTWLDAIDELALDEPGGDNTIANLLAPYGITTGSSTALAARAEARTAFHDLQAVFGDWVVPPVVLHSLADWHFDKAMASMAAAKQVRDTASQLATVLPDVDGMDGRARTLLEAAATDADIEAAQAAADDRLAAAGTVAEAKRAFEAPQDLVMQAGMLGTDLQPLLDAAIQAIRDDDPDAARSNAQAIQAALADAPQQGQVRLLVGIGAPALLLVLLIAFLLVRRRRRRRLLVPVVASASAAVESAAAPLDVPAALQASPSAPDALPASTEAASMSEPAPGTEPPVSPETGAPSSPPAVAEDPPSP